MADPGIWRGGGGCGLEHWRNGLLTYSLPLTNKQANKQIVDSYCTVHVIGTCTASRGKIASNLQLMQLQAQLLLCNSQPCWHTSSQSAEPVTLSLQDEGYYGYTQTTGNAADAWLGNLF